MNLHSRDRPAARDYADLHSGRGRLRESVGKWPESSKYKDGGKRCYGVDGLITRWFAYRARRLAEWGGLSLSRSLSMHSRILWRSNERIYERRERENENEKEIMRESERTDTD